MSATSLPANLGKRFFSLPLAVRECDHEHLPVTDQLYRSWTADAGIEDRRLTGQRKGRESAGHSSHQIAVRQQGALGHTGGTTTMDTHTQRERE